MTNAAKLTVAHPQAADGRTRTTADHRLDGRRGTGPVMQHLSRLTAVYITRAEPTGQPSATATHSPALAGRLGRFDPCVVEAVVTVDSKGRVPLPASLRAGDDATTMIVVGTTDAAVSVDVGPVGIPCPLDGRGRLTLRQGVLCAAGISPGDRLVIVRLADPVRIMLTLTTNLATGRAR